MTSNMFSRNNNTTDLFRSSNNTTNIFGSSNTNRPAGQQNTAWTISTNTSSTTNVNPFNQQTTTNMTTNLPSYGQSNQIGSLRAPKHEMNKYSCLLSVNPNTPQQIVPYHNKQWNDKTFPSSIGAVETTGPLSVIELRIEDYYLLRTNNIPENTRTFLASAASKTNFKCYNTNLNNPMLAKPITINQFYPLPSNSAPYSRTTTSTYQPSYGQPVGFNNTQQSGNIFGGSGSTNTNPVNPFATNNTNTTPNPFAGNMANNNNMRTSNTSNNNIFATNTQNNPFAQNPANNNAGNMFVNNNNMQQSNYNNPFAQNTNTNTTGNNNNSWQNRSTSNTNLFANQGSTPNLFANNTGGTGNPNIFANPMGNSTNNNTPNIFANNNSSNLFANNQSNNIFANNNNNNAGYSNFNHFNNSMQQSQVSTNLPINPFSYHPQSNTFTGQVNRPFTRDQLFGSNGLQQRTNIFSATPYYQQVHNNSAYGTNSFVGSYRPPVVSSASLYGPNGGSQIQHFQPLNGFDPERFVRSVVASAFSQMGMQFAPTYTHNDSNQSARSGSQKNYGNVKPRPLFDESDGEDERNNSQIPKVIIIREKPETKPNSSQGHLYYQQESVANIRSQDMRRGMHQQHQQYHRENIFNSPSSQHYEEFQQPSSFSKSNQTTIILHQKNARDVELTVEIHSSKITLENLTDKLIQKGRMDRGDKLRMVMIERHEGKPDIIECELERLPRINLPPGYQYSPEPTTTIVNNFKIWNNHGSVQWESDVDIDGVDFSNIVVIRESEVEFYPDRSPPIQGQELNKPCVVTFKKCLAAQILRQKNVSSSELKGKCEKKLRLACERNQAEFISYNTVTDEWSFRLKSLPVQGS